MSNRIGSGRGRDCFQVILVAAISVGIAAVITLKLGSVIKHTANPLLLFGYAQ